MVDRTRIVHGMTKQTNNKIRGFTIRDPLAGNRYKLTIINTYNQKLIGL